MICRVSVFLWLSGRLQAMLADTKLWHADRGWENKISVCGPLEDVVFAADPPLKPTTASLVVGPRQSKRHAMIGSTIKFEIIWLPLWVSESWVSWKELFGAQVFAFLYRAPDCGLSSSAPWLLGSICACAQMMASTCGVHLVIACEILCVGWFKRGACFKGILPSSYFSLEENPIGLLSAGVSPSWRC